MTPEERFERIDRQLEFLANHQGQLSARFDELGQFLLKTAQMLEGFARRTEARFEVVEESLRRLAEAGARTEERLARTDERLNVLINVVERHFSNGPQP